MIFSKRFIAFCVALLAKSACVDQSREVQRLLETRNCSGCTLSGLNIGLYEVRTVDLSQADLSKVCLINTNFQGANLNNTNLT